jgi:hypothetical protein
MTVSTLERFWNGERKLFNKHRPFQVERFWNGARNDGGIYAHHRVVSFQRLYGGWNGETIAAK